MILTFGLLTAALVAAIVMSHHMNTAKGGHAITVATPAGTVTAVLPAGVSKENANAIEKGAATDANFTDTVKGAQAAAAANLPGTAAVLQAKAVGLARATGVGADIDFSAYGPAYGVRVPQVIEQSRTIDDPAYGPEYGQRTPIELKQ